MILLNTKQKIDLVYIILKINSFEFKTKHFFAIKRLGIISELRILALFFSKIFVLETTPFDQPDYLYSYSIVLLFFNM